jgi:hypothetical protein
MKRLVVVLRFVVVVVVVVFISSSKFWQVARVDRISTGVGCPGVMTILSHELVV